MKDTLLNVAVRTILPPLLGAAGALAATMAPGLLLRRLRRCGPSGGAVMAPRSGPEYPFPVDDYAAAKRWLWTKGRVHEWLDNEPDDLPPVAVLICDMFWINPAKLLRDLRRD